MSASTAFKIAPLVSSGTAGPLKVMHLPRLWAKLTLDQAGMLPEGYGPVGPGFDTMTLKNLNLDKDEVLEYFKHQKPTYTQFEQWVLEKNGGKLDAEAIRNHNEAVSGYNHADDKAREMRQNTGVKHEHIKDAVTLNMVDDLHELHKLCTRPSR